jgi:hypothetical protein
MPIDELAISSRSEAAWPALSFILVLGLLDAFGPLSIDM